MTHSPHLTPLYVYLDLASVLLYIHIYYRSKGFFHVLSFYVYLDFASVLHYIHIYYRSKGFFHVLSFYENKVLVKSKTFYHIRRNLISKKK